MKSEIQHNHFLSIVVLILASLVLAFLEIQVCASEIWCNPANISFEDGLRKTSGFKTLHAALSRMVSGDTVVIANGDWRKSKGMFIDRNHKPPNGTSKYYSTVRAETDWSVKVPFINIDNGLEFTVFRGIVFDNRYIGKGNGHICYNANHIKFIRCGFLAHGLRANKHTCGFGSNDRTRKINQYNLMEECVAWGSGRYIYYSKYGKFNIFRRCIARHDLHDGAGTKDDGRISNFRAYACDFNIYQNCISIDSDRTKHFTSLNNEAAGFWSGDLWGATGNEIRGCISLKDVHLPYYISGDDGNGNNQIVNSVALDVTVPGYNTLSAFILVQNTNVIAENVLGIRALHDGQDGFYFKKKGSFIIRDSIVKDVKDIGLKVSEATGVNHYNAGSCVSANKVKQKLRAIFSCWGSNDTDYNPEQNGLRYPVRIEPASRLASGGKNEKRCGPEILKMIGVSGTLYGEPGWDKVTDKNLWPFPNEKRVRELMRETIDGVSGLYGFCANGQTLSNYIWGYFGNTVPPFNVQATPQDRAVSLTWDRPADVAIGAITGFNVYNITGGSRVLMGGIVGSKTYSKTITGLTNGKPYEFEMTAIDKTKGESGPSYKVRVTPQKVEKVSNNKSAPVKIKKAKGGMKSIGMPAKKEFINNLGMAFVFVPPGSFEMGILSEKGGRSNNTMPHQVTLTKGFYMQTTEVTQGQWKALMGNNPSFFKDYGDDYPLEQVSWHEVQQFINQLNRIEGTGRYRLPTEAEWEYACRAGNKTPFSFGKCLTTEQANYNGNFPFIGCQKERYAKVPISVKSFPPNAWGLKGMHGNVWEWCQDWLGEYPGHSLTDPLGPPTGSLRVIRGGGWNSYASACRSGNRSGNEPTKRFANLGFRVARDR